MTLDNIQKPTIINFQVEADITIAAEAWGNPAAPPVLLLHGGGQTRHSWGQTAKILASKGWYAIAYDARGHGKSSWSADARYALEFLVNDLKTIIAQLNKNQPW